MELFPLLIILLAVFLLFRSSTRVRAQQRQLKERQNQVAVGERVLTTSGMFGTVTAMDEETVTIEASPGNLSTWSRAAIGEVLTLTPSALDDEEPSTGG